MMQVEAVFFVKTYNYTINANNIISFNFKNTTENSNKTLNSLSFAV